MASDTDEHQLKLRTLRAKLSNVSNDFKEELINNKRRERPQKDNSYKNSTISSLPQAHIQTNASLASASNKSKQPPIQESQKISSQEHLTLQEDLRSRNYDFVSDEKIFQKTKPNWESWKYIPRKKLDRLKKKTLGHIFKNKDKF